MKLIQNSKLKIKNYGFTLIEVILYVAIVAIMLSALIPFAWTIISNGTRSATDQEVSSNARFIAEKIKYEIRRSSGITIASGSTLSLSNFAPDATSVFDLQNGKIRFNKNNAGPISLNSNDVTVSSLVFSNNSGTGSKNIQFSFTLNSNFTQSRSEYQRSINVEGDAEVRSL